MPQSFASAGRRRYHRRFEHAGHRDQPARYGHRDHYRDHPGRTSKTTEGHYTYTTRPEPAQSISFSVPASGTAGGSAGLSGTGGGSGNPVVFSVDDASGAHVCHVSGTTVTYTAAGTCVIDANQAGNDSYADAPQVQGKIMVILVPQYRGISSSFSQ